MNEIAIQENPLTKVINETGVELVTANLIQSKFAGYFEQLHEWQSKPKIVVTDASQKKEMKMAKEIRLAVKEIRVEGDKTRKLLKEDSNQYGKAVQNSYNLLESLCKPLEEYYEMQEKFAEIQEQKRILELKAKRESEINPYIEFIPTGLNLGTMQDSDYDKLLNGAKLQLAAKQEADAKAEKERLEKIEVERIENERIKAENEKLRLEAIEKQKELDKKNLEEKKEKDKLAKRNSELKPYIVFIRDYGKMLEMDEVSYQKELAEIKKGAELEWEEKRKAMAKEQAELQAKQEANSLKLQAGDKEKLLELASQLSLVEFPKVESAKANLILSQALERLQKTIKTIQDEAGKL